MPRSIIGRRKSMPASQVNQLFVNTNASVNVQQRANDENLRPANPPEFPRIRTVPGLIPLQNLSPSLRPSGNDQIQSNSPNVSHHQRSLPALLPLQHLSPGPSGINQNLSKPPSFVDQLRQYYGSDSIMVLIRSIFCSSFLFIFSPILLFLSFFSILIIQNSEE